MEEKLTSATIGGKPLKITIKLTIFDKL